MANKGHPSDSVENDYGRTLAEAEGTDVKKVDDMSHSWQPSGILFICRQPTAKWTRQAWKRQRIIQEGSSKFRDPRDAMGESKTSSKEMKNEK